VFEEEMMQSHKGKEKQISILNIEKLYEKGWAINHLQQR
jgi:hypothetical protein